MKKHLKVMSFIIFLISPRCMMAAQTSSADITYLSQELKKASTIKELKQIVNRLETTDFAAINSRQGKQVVSQHIQKILTHVQQELHPWIDNAKETSFIRPVEFPNIVRDGIDAVITGSYFRGHTTLLLLIGTIDPQDQNYWPVKLLVDNDANVNKASPEGKTPLMSAVMADNLAIANLLLKNGARIDQQDNKGFTALFLAAARNNVVMVKFLLQQHADPKLKLKQLTGSPVSNMNVLQFAEWRRKNIKDTKEMREIVQMLESAMIR